MAFRFLVIAALCCAACSGSPAVTTVPTMFFTTDVRGGSVKWANQLYDRAEGAEPPEYSMNGTPAFVGGVLDFLGLS